MKEEFTSIRIQKHFHSELYQSCRFIHRSVVFVIYERIHENSFMTNLVTRILSRGTKNYLRSYELSRYLYSLYGSYLDGSVTKWGQNLVYTLTIKNLIPESWDDPLPQSINLALEMLLEANWDHRKFFNSYFQEEKSNQISELKDLINDKFRYTFEQFIKWMFEGEPFGISILGDEKRIHSLDNLALSTYYQDSFLRQNRMVFFLDEKLNPMYKEIADRFSAFTPLEKKAQVSIRQVTKQKRDQVRRKTEKDSIQQSLIFMGYRFDQELNQDQYPALLLLNNLWGGQSNSILYRKVREEKGLCYLINSSLPAGINSLIVSAGIAWKNRKAFEDVLGEEMSLLTHHLVDPALFAASKELTLTALKSILDHPFQLISMRIESVLFQRNFHLADMIQKVREVTREQLQAVAQKLYLDCIFTLQGTE